MGECDFDKYAVGAIHWMALSKSPKKHNLAFDARYRRCVSLLSGKLPGKGQPSILDLGCGDGALFYYLRKGFPGARLFGIDGSKDGIEHARAALAAHSVEGVELTHLDFNDLGTVEARFDAVTCLDVIEHMRDMDGFLKKIRALLSDEGVLVMSTPVRLLEHPNDKDHERELFCGEFRRLVEHAGFEVVEHVETTPVYDLIRYFKATRLGIGKTKLMRTYYNLLNILFGYNVFLRRAPGASYTLYETQFIVARKR